jgi:hypothetical protein
MTSLPMALQSCAVALIVGACLVYAVWALLPQAARRPAAAALLALPGWPAALAARLRKAAKAPPSCGCDGCDKSPLRPAARAVQPVTFQRRIGR